MNMTNTSAAQRESSGSPVRPAKGMKAREARKIVKSFRAHMTSAPALADEMGAVIFNVLHVFGLAEGSAVRVVFPE